MVVKILLTGLLALSMSCTQALPVYSSNVWNTRSEHCKNTAATAEAVVKVGLTRPFVMSVYNNPVVKKLPKPEQLVLFDSMFLAAKLGSSWWVFDYCMERLET